MSLSHWQRSHGFTTPDTVTDVLVLGGGFVGLSTAYWLAELRPDLKITVLERKTCGDGASGKNAGFLTKGSSTFYHSLTTKWGAEKAQQLREFAELSLQLVHQNILKTSPELKHESTSSLTLIRKGFDLGYSEDYKPEKFGFEWLGQDDLPTSLRFGFEGAYKTSPEFKVNPIQLLTTLKNKLISRKVQILENVSGFELTDAGIKTDVNFIECKKIVLALNAYLPQFHQAFSKVVIPRRAQMLAIELLEDFDCPFLAYDPEGRVYFRKTDDRSLVIGGKRLMDPEGEMGDFEKTSPLVQKGLETYLQEQLKIKYKVVHRWSGIMGFSDHELPYIEKISSPLETYLVGGFSGHGMGFGFLAGKETAELVLGQKTETLFGALKKSGVTL